MNEIIKKNGVSFGLIFGLFSVLLTTTLYLVDLELFTSSWIGIISVIISISIGVVLITKTKKQLNNVLTFKEGFTVYFIAAAIGSTISTLFNYILFNFVDPGAKETIKEITLKYTSDMMAKFGAPADAVNETMKKLAETDNFSLGNLAMGLAFSLVFSALFGLILAAIFKSKSPSSQGL
ncbi:DUF4199 domain-containing protein [Flavobacterium sp. AS60]|uniref:DUF4199 domain-containing protein n=1 Tax=Flavobacterium anseongense TaxID=2910677 RepID=UPI001F32CBED|nr:DUF4199 domain-containing protein [Flavobacterium sp. AS60]MCF6128144.1 DUF4199 domain-containing protein [Flavobacterium sp. AS60]